jgi:hypothetical protein
MGIFRNLWAFKSFYLGDYPRSTKLPRRRSLEVSALEERRLLSFAGTAIHATPMILPPNNKYIPVTVTGTFQEYHVVTVGKNVQLVNSVQPGPKRASFQVVDQYRRVQPQRKISLVITDPAKAIYSYSFTVFLQATRRNADVTGRHYNVIVGAGDTDGWNGMVVTVLVPHSV